MFKNSDAPPADPRPIAPRMPSAFPHASRILRPNEEERRNPHSPYAGKFGGIANGQVVVVSDDLDELAQRLDEVEPDPTKTFWIKASSG
jgi:hypothetical protein